MTLMAVPVDGVLGTIYDLAEADEGSAILLLQMGIYEALCSEVDKALPRLQPVLAGHFARQADGMLEQTAKRYAIAKGLGQDTAELEAIAEHLSTARDAWVTIGKMTPEEFDALESQGRINRDAQSGRFSSAKIRSSILNALNLSKPTPDDKIAQQTQQALGGLVGSDADAYSRIRALGQGLAASGNPHAKAVGTAARLTADIGPEAQRVLEPGIRRTAYRYRGTEKRPNKGAQNGAVVVAASAYPEEIGSLPEGLQNAVARASKEVSGTAEAGTKQLMTAPGRKAPSAGQLSPVAGAIAANPSRPDWTEDQLRLARTSDYGALLLRKQIPDVDTATISLAAGKMPPSVGMMFDADGRLVSEAQGFNGDHYLPFDLRNLKRLKGGSYVRTRTTGGLTDEDIYTGLMTGARQVTVVSNSGVFTIEFDPDLRGGRRYSDKARQMVARYGALTSVIGGGTLQQTDLPPARLKELRQQAIASAGGSKEQAQTNYRDLVEAERFEQSFLGVDEDELMAQAGELANQEYASAVRSGGNKPQVSTPRLQQAQAQIFADLKAQALKDQAKAYRLDHDGYAAAMKALKTEFPYFIRDARTQPLNEFLVGRKALRPDEDLPKRGGRDLGHTRPGGLSPEARMVTGRDASGTKTYETDAQREQRISGLKSSRIRGASTPAAEQEAPEQAQRSTVSPVGASDTEALTLEQASALAAKNSTHKLSRALNVLDFRADIADKPVAALDPNSDIEQILAPDNPETLKQNDAEYTDWLLQAFDSSRERAVFLADNPKHAEKARKGLLWLRKQLDAGYEPSEDYVTAESITEAAELLGTASGGGFAEPQPNWVLYSPDPGKPQPQLLPEIAALGFSKKNIAAFARSNQPVLDFAVQYQDEEPAEVALAIQYQAEEIDELIAWGGRAGVEAPEGRDSQRALAQKLASHPDEVPMYRMLAQMQAAWSLVAANKMAAVAHNVPELRFEELVAPKAPPPQAESVGKRLVVHSPSSPAALGLAKRRAASPRAVRLPVSG